MQRHFRKFIVPAAAAAIAAAASVSVFLLTGESDNVSAGSSVPLTVTVTVPAPAESAPTTTTATSQPKSTPTTTTTEELPPATEATPPPPDPAQPPEVQPTLLDVTLTPQQAEFVDDIKVVGGQPHCRPPYEGIELFWEKRQDFAGNDVWTHAGEDETPTVYVEFEGAFNPIVAFIADNNVVFDVVPTKYGTEIAGVMRLQPGYIPNTLVACTDADW